MSRCNPPIHQFQPKIDRETTNTVLCRPLIIEKNASAIIMAKKAWSLVETFFPEFMFAAVPGIFIANGLCRDGPSIVNTLGEHH